jgi:RNA recognition motif-containing protein
LPFSTDENRLNELFAQYGAVESVHIVTDRMTGRSRGFGFVEMASSEEAAAAIEALNGTDLDGRAITVNEAKPREQRSGGHSDRRGRGGGQGRGRW